MRTFENGARIALEIEWNNKDPFYDRDLENYKRLHADGAISVGIIDTRGKSLHENMRELVRRFVDQHHLEKLDDLIEWGYDPTSKQRSAITKQITRKRDPLTFREAFTNKFVADKFGEATTHWRKLEDRVHRGVGILALSCLACQTASLLSMKESERLPRLNLQRLAKRQAPRQPNSVPLCAGLIGALACGQPIYEKTPRQKILQ